jgi:hypothetical protein
MSNTKGSPREAKRTRRCCLLQVYVTRTGVFMLVYRINTYLSLVKVIRTVVLGKAGRIFGDQID